MNSSIECSYKEVDFPEISRMPRLRPIGVAYPDWFRAKVLEAPVHESTRSIAVRLKISQSTVSRILKQNESVSGKPGPMSGSCLLTEDDAAFLCLLKCSYPQASLIECQIALLIERGKQVSVATVSRELKRLGMTRKLMQSFSTRRDESRRVAWWTNPPHLGGCAGVDWTNLVDIDEANVKFGDTRRKYGHSLSGQPARASSFVSCLNLFSLCHSQPYFSAKQIWQIFELIVGSFTSFGCCCLHDLSR